MCEPTKTVLPQRRGPGGWCVRLLVLFIRGYQLFLSPLKQVFFGSSCGCRFQPTCSAYAREALLRHGVWRGLCLAIRRILKCHPWGTEGYDPVPSLKSCRRHGISAPFKSIIDG